MNVKKLLAAFLVLFLMITGALAEEAEAPAATPMPASAPNYEELIVGSTTELSGNFFSEMFGNNTADLDVRTLLHDYNLMEWQGAGAYGINPSVVSGIIATDDPDGNRTYTVAIYSGLAYSDGTPITTADYAFSMMLSIDPAMLELGVQTVGSDYIVGIDEYKAGQTEILSGIHLINDRIMSVTVKAEYQPFFYEMALLDYNPYPIHIIAPGCEVVDDGRGVQIRNIDPEVKEPLFTAELLRKTILDPETGYLTHPSAVSGPYQLDSYDEQTHVATFSINPYFKGNSHGEIPQIQRLVYKPVNPETMIEELERGEVGLINKATGVDVITAGLALEDRGGFEAAYYPRRGYSFISFSCERTVVGDSVVRQAIAHCLDKDALVYDYVGDYGVAVDGYYGIGQWIYQLVNGELPVPVDLPPEDAAEEETFAYEEQLAQWSNIGLDNITVYPLDVDEAIRLLESDGWTLNREGKAYDAQVDDVRCKEIDGELVALDLKMTYPEENSIGDSFEATFFEHLAKAGIRVTAEALPMTELLDVYYRNVAREYDLIYLATNFATVFDPTYTFSPADAYQGKRNRSGIADEELYLRTVDMRTTVPGDVLSYVRKWVAFQERWTEVLPAIPVYSNLYFDFYTDALRDYKISSGITWADAIVSAYLGEPRPEEPQEGSTLASALAAITGE